MFVGTLKQCQQSWSFSDSNSDVTTVIFKHKIIYKVKFLHVLTITNLTNYIYAYIYYTHVYTYLYTHIHILFLRGEIFENTVIICKPDIS